MTPSPLRFKPWGLWATLGLSFCVWVVFVASQTLVAVTALLVYGLQHAEADIGLLAERLEANGLVLAIATLVSAPLCIGLICLFIRLRRNASIRAYLHLTRPRWRTLVFWCGLTVVFVYGIDFLKSLLDRPTVPTFTTDVYGTAYFLPLLYLAIVVAAPLFEEIFFRGFMFQGIQHSRLGAVGAVLIPSIIWAVIHSQYDVYDMAGIFVFGLLLSVAQLITRSLYVAIAMHALNNILALISVAFSQSVG